MSLDLYREEIAERMSSLAPVRQIEAGAFDGFLRGAGMSAMRSFAQAGRALSLSAIAPVALVDEMAAGHPLGAKGATIMADRLFKIHDDVFGSAVDYWTPRPNEVGAAGQVAGQLVSMLPLVIASPAFAVGATGLGAAEDLARQGVDTARSVGVGVAQAGGLGLGIWMPILGQNLWQRMVVGGAALNVLQGAAMRGASGLILEGTAAAEQFRAFDGEALTLDVLLGLAFGSLAHLSPAQRAQGAEVWNRIRGFAESLSPQQVEAVTTLRAAQHINVDSTPGKPLEVQDIEAHVQRMRTAIDQLAKDQRVEIEDLPAARMQPDEPRLAGMMARARELAGETTARVRAEESIPPIQETEGPPAPTGAETPPPRGEGEAPARPTAKDGEPAPDPLTLEATRFAGERPDLAMRIGTDPDGQPIVKPLKQYLDDARAEIETRRKDASLFEVAAACMMGVA